MKKAVKSTLIWGTTVAVAAGIAVAIAVPVTNAKNKVTNTNPIKNFDEAKEVIPGLTGTQLLEALNNAGIKDASLLNKTQYQLAFHLYDSEQKGSVELQQMYFQWDLFTLNKNLKNFILNTIGNDETVADIAGTPKVSDVVVSAEKAQFDALYSHAQKVIETKYGSDSDKKSALTTSLSDMKTNWNKKSDLINALKNNTQDYDSYSFSSNYPKVLLPLTTIRNKQETIYNSTKNTFVSNYATKGQGNAEWQKQLSAKYGGATSDAQAIDYLVNQQVSASAWTKYSYSINTEFTFEQLKSNVFKDILGEATKDANDVWTVAGGKAIIRTDKTKYNDNDKVYFFGTASRIPSEINLTGSTRLDEIFKSNSNLMKIQNAILGFKQNTSNRFAPWTITKDQLTKLFSTYKSNSRPVDQWQNVFADADANGKDLTKNLIGLFSDTTDSTQWKSGDLGWQTQLSGLGGFYEGFSLGLASALDDMKAVADEKIGGTVDGHSVTWSVWNSSGQGSWNDYSGNFLNYLMLKIKNAFDSVRSSKGWTVPSVGSADYNTIVTQYISTLTDDEMSRYFGNAIKVAFDNLRVRLDGAGTATIGTATTSEQNNIDSAYKQINGIPSAIRLDNPTSSAKGTGIFMVNADQAGMHVIKVQTGSAVVQSMKDEMQADADSLKQDKSLIVTNWGKFVSDAYTQPTQMADALGIKVSDANPTIEAKIAEYLESKIDALGYKADEKDKMKSDIIKLVVSLKNSEGLSKVQSAYRDGVYTWLQDKIDKKLWTNEDSISISPEEIYGTLLTAEGI